MGTGRMMVANWTWYFVWWMAGGVSWDHCNCAHCLVGITQKRTRLRSAAFEHSDPHGDEDREAYLAEDHAQEE